jgi:hypothetical protein
VAALRQSNPDDRALVPILWQALINAGAMRHGIFANLDSWMFRQKYGCRHPEDLTAAQAADAVRKLSFWLGRTYTEAQQAASSPA